MLPSHGNKSSAKTMTNRVDKYYLYHDVRAYGPNGPTAAGPPLGPVIPSMGMGSHSPMSVSSAGGSMPAHHVLYEGHHQDYLKQQQQQQPDLTDVGAVRTSTWTYKHGVNSVIERGEKIRPERAHVRRPVQRMNWRNSRWIQGFSEEELPVIDSRLNSMTISDVSPKFALTRIIALYENQQYREAAGFITRLNHGSFKAILTELPIDLFIDSMPQSLSIIEALYAKVFLSDGLHFTLKFLRPESVLMQMVRFFANHHDETNPPPGLKREMCGPFVSSCKKLLKVICLSDPKLRKMLANKKRSLDMALEGMGQHGLVGTSDEALMNLHDAMKVEFEKAVQSYKAALQKLEELSLANKTVLTRSVSHGPAPIQASHQRLLALKQDEVQERLIKNKTLLNVIEPTLTNNSLSTLLGILQRRVDFDKDGLFQFTQLRKEIKDINPTSIMAPILMKYSHGCGQVLQLIREVANDTDVEEEDSSDISGYHSDSDSAIIMSGNSPFLSKRVRYNFLRRSVRTMKNGSVASSYPAWSSPSSGSASGGSGSGSESPPPPNKTPLGKSASVDLASTAGIGTKSKKHVTTGSITSGSSGVHSASTSSILAATASPNSVAGSGVNGRANGAMSRLRHLKQKKEVHKLHSNASNSSEDRGSLSEMDIHSIASNPVTTLERENDVLRRQLDKQAMELHHLHQQILSLKDREQKWKERVAEQAQKLLQPTMPHQFHHRPLNNVLSAPPVPPQMPNSHTNGAPPPPPPPPSSSQHPSNNHSPLASNCSMSGGKKFENLADGDRRPSALIAKYAELYSQTRVDAYEALSEVQELSEARELKEKLLFSVVVLAFRSVLNTKQQIKESIRRILQIPPNLGSPKGSESSKQNSSASSSASSSMAAAAPQVESSVETFLQYNCEQHDLTKNVEDVCTQIWATLYDYPSLNQCEGLVTYVKNCVRVAWGLVNQNPPFVIEYEARVFRKDMHVRFYLSKEDSDDIKTYLWPALLEGENGPCIHQGVVIT